MERSIERVPTWALPYMANGDATGLKDKEIKMIDNLLRNRTGMPHCRQRARRYATLLYQRPTIRQGNRSGRLYRFL